MPKCAPAKVRKWRMLSMDHVDGCSNPHILVMDDISATKEICQLNAPESITLLYRWKVSTHRWNNLLFRSSDLRLSNHYDHMALTVSSIKLQSDS